MPRQQVERELAELYHQAGFRGAPLVKWTDGLARTHRSNTRRYAQVLLHDALPPIFQLAPQTVWLPAPNRRALLAHEVGHALDPNGGEDDADAAAGRHLGVRIGYDHRWPGKGLQVARNPDVDLRELERQAQAEGTPEAWTRLALEAKRRGLPMPPPWPWWTERMTPEQIGKIMELARANRARVEATFAPGHGMYTGRLWDWPPENVQQGLPHWTKKRFFIGRSTGRSPVYLAIDNRRSMGGDPIRPDEFAYMRWLSQDRQGRWSNNPGDPRLRQLERAWKEGGGPESEAAYLREAMRRGLIGPDGAARLWVLARADEPDAPAIRAAFGELIPIARTWQGGFQQLVFSVHEASMTRAYHYLLASDLLAGLAFQPGGVTNVPRQRVVTRLRAFVLLLQSLGDLWEEHIGSHSPYTESAFDNEGQTPWFRARAAEETASRIESGGPPLDNLLPADILVLGEWSATFQDSYEHLVHHFDVSGVWSETVEVPREVRRRCKGDPECVGAWASDQGSGVWDMQHESFDVSHDLQTVVGFPGTYYITQQVFEYLYRDLVDWLREPLEGDVQANPPVRRNFRPPPPCDPSKRPLPKGTKGRVRVHVNLHNGCYVVSKKGKVIGYTRALTLKNVVPKVSLAGHERCNTYQVRNVHAYLEGDLVKHSATKPRGKGWDTVTYNCKTSGPFFLNQDGVPFEGAEEARFARAKKDGREKVVVYVKGRPPAKRNPGCACRFPGGGCGCGYVQSWWREPPPQCGP